MRTWDVFFPDVLPEVLGCPEPTVERALLRASQDWCVQTRCWRADLDRINLRAGTPDYDVSYPSKSEGVQFIGAVMNGSDVDLEVADGTSTARRLRGTGGTRRVLCQDQRTATVIPTPANTGTLVLTAILKPSEDAPGVPNDIGDRFRSDIANGALAQLLIMNKAEWRNESLAGIKQAMFMKRIAEVRKAVWKAFTNTRPRAVGMYF